MFILNETQKGLPKNTEPRVVSVLNSINEPKIAAADHSAEPTQAYVCTISEGEKLLTHIVLYLSKSHDRVMYSWDEGAVPPKKQPEVESEALDFVENMGFMMDNLNLAKFSKEQRQELLADLPVFSEEKGKSKGKEKSKPKEEEAVVLLDEVEESLDDLIKLANAPEAPTAVASPLKKPALAPEFNEDESLLLMEAEFAREPSMAGDEPSAGFEFTAPAPKAPAKAAPAVREAKAEPMVMDKTRFRAVLRFLSSL